MRLRTQWMAAFIVLAALPLSAITLYAYHSSSRALQRTAQSEAAPLPLERDLARFAAGLDRSIDESTPAEVYLTLFLSVLDPVRRELRYANSGHESPFLLPSLFADPAQVCIRDAQCDFPGGLITLDRAG